MANRKILRARKQIANGTGEQNPEPTTIDNGNIEPVADNDNDSVTATDSDSDTITVNPSDIGESGNSGSDSTPKRRGRKPGSKNKSKQQDSAQNLATSLYMIHLTGAMLLKVPEIAIGENEAQALGTAIQAVNEQYGFTGIVPDKYLVLINLAMVAGKIYVPRARAIMARVNEEKNNPEDKVAQFPQQVN